MKLSAMAAMMCTLTALPDIYYRETQAQEAQDKAQEARPKPPELKQGQVAKYNPLSRSWRIYEPKQPKYRVVQDTDEAVYLARREANARIEEARCKRVAQSMIGKSKPNAAKFDNRAQVARAEADACARTLVEIGKQAEV